VEEVADRTWAAVEQARVEKQLRASEARFADECALLATLVEHLPAGVIVVDHQANALLCNPAYLRIVPEAAIPSQLPDAAQRWTAYNERHQHIRQDDFPGARALRGEAVAGAEFLHRAPDGQETWVRIGAVPLRDSAGTISGALCVIVDIDAKNASRSSFAN
jgi:PAS domain-containing protein